MWVGGSVFFFINVYVWINYDVLVKFRNVENKFFFVIFKFEFWEFWWYGSVFIVIGKDLENKEKEKIKFMLNIIF